MTMNNKPELKSMAALVGLDWADQKHDVALRIPGAERVEMSAFQHDPQSIADWVSALRRRFGQGQIAICLEQSRGALLYALMGYEHLRLYPINPKTLAKLRAALYPGGKKDDPVDAHLLLSLLEKFGDRLTPWTPDDPATRQLMFLVEARRGFVDQCTALSNQLGSVLKSYFPQALDLIGADLSSPLASDFLKKWPTLAAVRQARLSTVRAFYYGHNCRTEQRIQQRLNLIQQTVALTNDSAVINAQSLAAQSLAVALSALRRIIARYDQQIAQLFARHPDAAIFASLEGAGEALAPRLLVAFGTDRQRFAHADAMPCYSGTAPVTEKSGKQKWVHWRWARPVFVHQSFVEFALHSVPRSRWAKCCYDELIAKGHGHWAALRVLAIKWQRILWRCWQDRTPYDEATYLKSLQRRGLKTYAALWSENTLAHCE